MHKVILSFLYLWKKIKVQEIPERGARTRFTRYVFKTNANKFIIKAMQLMGFN